MTTLLITSAIQPMTALYMSVTDPARRLLAVRGAIYRWIDRWDIRNVVIVDGSNRKPLNDDDLALFGQLGVRVEQIAYAQSLDKLQRYGKGYGESEAMDLAVDSSALLKEAGSFYKITGKQFVENFREIEAVLQAHDVRAIFYRVGIRDQVFPRIDTRFFYTSLDFYRDCLRGAWAQIDDMQGRPIEKVYFDLVSARLRSASTHRPIVSGLAGGTGAFAEDVFGYRQEQEFPAFYLRGADATDQPLRATNAVAAG